MVTKPTDNDIWSVLEETAPKEKMEAVAGWLATEEGLKWIERHSEEMFRNAEMSSGDDVPSEEMLRNIHERIALLAAKKRRRRIMMNAAAIFIPVILLFSIWANINTRVGNILTGKSETVCETSELGERKTVIFQDGTKVYLNAGAKISYPRTWGLRTRSMSLEGEGFFEVAANHRRPFIVDIYGTQVKVYGTSFNIKAYPDEDTIDIVLLEGDVKFEAEGKEYDIEPSEQLVYSRISGNVDITSLESPSNATLWTRNVIMFRNNTLKEITETLGRWYDVRFEAADTSLYSRRFTFRTQHQPLGVLLEEMEYISDLKFELQGTTVTISQKNQ